MARGKKIIEGIPASPGEVICTVRIVDKDPEKLEKVKPGEAIVGERFNPEHDIYLKKAAALITDVGGVTSHTAIVAREWGIPAIVQTLNGTTVLKDGQKVVVDATGGAVYEYVPVEEEKFVKAESLADKMAALAKAKGISIDPAFLEKMKRRE